MKRSIALAALSAALLVVAAPAMAQQNNGNSSRKVTVSSSAPQPRIEQPVKVSYSWMVTGLPGMVPNIGQGNELLEGGPRLKLDQGPPVPVSHYDFGAYEPFIPQLAREALREADRNRGVNPRAGNGVHDVDVTLTGNPNRTVASVIYSTPAVGGQVTARAGVIVPALQVIGDPALQKNFVRAKDLKVDVKYQF